MDLSPVLDPLNDAQRAAVTAPLGPVLVLAGAGSGKTRVLTHRIAWVIEALGASPHGILAVTFTNKAAGEMRARVEQLLGVPPGALWIGTFHGIAHRLLRLHWREAQLAQGFQILDSEDQQRLIRKVIKAAELDEARWVPREVQWFINSNKDEGRRPAHLKDGDDPTRSQLIRLYAAYEEACARSGVVDFAELLLRAYELWRDNAALLSHYQRRFQHVLVDEFQDTNAIQYAWMRLLAPPQPAGRRRTVARAPWRSRSWWGTTTSRSTASGRARREPAAVPPRLPARALFRLEQNYRSTATILEAANGLIGTTPAASARSCGPPGRAASPSACTTPSTSATRRSSSTHRIREHVAQGGAAARGRDPVPLERAVARVRGGVPVGARPVPRVRRPALLRARGDQGRARLPAPDRQPPGRRLLRARGQPAGARHRREEPGAAARTARAARRLAVAGGRRGAARAGTLGARAAAALAGFMALIERLAAATAALALHEQVDQVLKASGLVEHYRREKAERGEARVENLDELVSAARGFAPEGSELAPLEAFLAHAALESGEGQADGVGGLRADDDAAQRQGARVPGGVPRRYGGGPVSAPALARRPRRPRGGAAAVLRRHDARHAPPVPELRRAAPAARRGQLRAGVALRARDPRRAHRGGAPEGAGVAPAGGRALPARGAGGAAACASARACATASSARAWCSTSRARARTRAYR